MIQTHVLDIPVITIDGPSGVGKGTQARKLAHFFGFHFLDSGAIYRLLAFKLLKDDISILGSTDEIIACAHTLDISFGERLGVPWVMLEGEDVSDAIRTEGVGKIASVIAALPEVRQALLDRQVAFVKPPGLIADGRDMGTVVFPDAPMKFYLDATPELRAERRQLQLRQLGIDVSLDALCQEIRLRDERDRDRVVAPLKPAHDAIIIDTTTMDIEAVFQSMLQHIQAKFGWS